MKRFAQVLIISLVVLMLGSIAVSAAVALDNGDFESQLPPRERYQGWENEYIYGWKPFAGTAWVGKGDHVMVIEHPQKPGQHVLKLSGRDDGYVGLRSHHVPVTPGSIYAITANVFVEELAEPSRMQVWLEFWPADTPSETSGDRMHHTRATAKNVGVWQELAVADIAPEGAATATVLVIIHRSGQLALVPAEVMVDDITITELK
ncbi:MAG TPA: hypothetical protein GXZ82_03820 [Firmicutes bacterium]|jgi:hypothetical protein|nr:hypothetical protein [Bacillota bacterium]